MKLLQRQLTTKEKRYCEHHLKQWDVTCNKLTDDMFTENTLACMLKYEADTRRRNDVMYRLSARYGKVKRQREWLMIKSYVRKNPAYNPVEMYDVPESI